MTDIIDKQNSNTIKTTYAASSNDCPQEHCVCSHEDYHDSENCDIFDCEDCKDYEMSQLPEDAYRQLCDIWDLYEAERKEFLAKPKVEKKIVEYPPMKQPNPIPLTIHELSYDQKYNMSCWRRNFHLKKLNCLEMGSGYEPDLVGCIPYMPGNSSLDRENRFDAEDLMDFVNSKELKENFFKYTNSRLKGIQSNDLSPFHKFIPNCGYYAKEVDENGRRPVVFFAQYCNGFCKKVVILAVDKTKTKIFSNIRDAILTYPKVDAPNRPEIHICSQMQFVEEEDVFFQIFPLISAFETNLNEIPELDLFIHIYWNNWEITWKCVLAYVFNPFNVPIRLSIGERPIYNRIVISVSITKILNETPPEATKRFVLPYYLEHSYVPQIEST